MGLNVLRSSSDYDKKYEPVEIDRIVIKDRDGIPYKETKSTKLPNPDPKNYIINDYWNNGSYMLVDITYPDCTNYEGRKYLLYKNVTIKQLKAQKSIDPHFSENKKFYSPIARFEPSGDGWHNAMLLMETFAKLSIEQEFEGYRMAHSKESK